MLQCPLEIIGLTVCSLTGILVPLNLVVLAVLIVVTVVRMRK